MSHIVAARFERSLDADAALEALRREFPQNEIDSFAVNPPGQHGLHPMGGDVGEDAGTHGAGAAGAIGAGLGLIVGLVIGAIASLHYGGPVLYILGGIGALIGAFAGVMPKLHDPAPAEHTAEHPLELPAGRMIAVLADRPGVEDKAVSILRNCGARNVGHTEGQWVNGWRDFDPRRPLPTA